MIPSPGTPEWDRAVAEGIAVGAATEKIVGEAVGARNWRWGDLALSVAPMRDHGGARRGTDQAEGVPLETTQNLARYADAIGVNVGSLSRYRAVAAAWPTAERVETSWTVHFILAGRKDLIRPGMTVTEAHAALGNSAADRRRPSEPSDEVYTPDQVRALVEEAVALKQYHEPDRADFLGVPTEAMSGGLAALLEREDDDDEAIEHEEPEPGPATAYQERRAREARAEPPRERGAVGALEDLIDAERVNVALLRLVERIRAGGMDAMPPEIKAEAATLFRAWIDALQWACVVIEGGAVTDAALAEFLSG